MHPLTAAEQGDAFDLGKSLCFGRLPARFNDPDRHRYLKDYVQTTIIRNAATGSITGAPAPKWKSISCCTAPAVCSPSK